MMYDIDYEKPVRNGRAPRRWWCRIVGHRWDEDALTFMGMADCHRCGYSQYQGPKEPFTMANWLWWRRHFMWRRWERLKDWWRDVTRRFRKVDDDVPF